ncbi:hypothetical protein E6W39_28805 [Kitasatospora acidiphila]|uniref:Uncharacterized protein n=1 Tax=Kitasatospora acidiphila TaxID=2567942 RepID=A0A540W8Z1_9ACTN|nr:hypothetical protein [Kitasatospora acidiphila]TQF05499.1 hypothetical protein E6W39_28805 [Kitasatospora acidiphila]
MNTVRELRQSTMPVGPIGGPWSVRAVASQAGRPALEVYESGELIDVLVASSLNSEVLRGARRSRVGGLAWGRLAADGSPPDVAFAQTRVRARWEQTETVVLAGGFWLAWTSGPALAVMARRADGGIERLRPARLV